MMGLEGWRRRIGIRVLLMMSIGLIDWFDWINFRPEGYIAHTISCWSKRTCWANYLYDLTTSAILCVFCHHLIIQQFCGSEAIVSQARPPSAGARGAACWLPLSIGQLLGPVTAVCSWTRYRVGNRISSYADSQVIEGFIRQRKRIRREGRRLDRG